MAMEGRSEKIMKMIEQDKKAKKLQTFICIQSQSLFNVSNTAFPRRVVFNRASEPQRLQLSDRKSDANTNAASITAQYERCKTVPPSATRLPLPSGAPSNASRSADPSDHAVDGAVVPRPLLPAFDAAPAHRGGVDRRYAALLAARRRGGPSDPPAL